MATSISGIRALTASGEFGMPRTVSWAGGVFALDGPPAPDAIDGRGLWLIPGLVDAHAHVSWHAFDAQDRSALSAEQRNRATGEVLGRMLRAGFTSVRDAGGLTLEMLAEVGAHVDERADGKVSSADGAVSSADRARFGTGAGHPLPRVQTSVALIDRASADAAGGVLAEVERVLEAGARWVKLVGTASVASPAGAGLDPTFTAAEQAGAVARAAEVGAGVMLHAWGGQAIDDAIDAGAFSIEHGIFLTDRQAKRAAERGMTLVPTLRIYRLVQRMIDEGALPEAFRRRVDEAVGAHPEAVRRARDAGLAIALGSDYSTLEQHGTNALEFDALRGRTVGLSAAEALIAATRAGAELLARVAPDPAQAPSGRIENGEIADGVILNQDPREIGVLSDPTRVVAVLLGGQLLGEPFLSGQRPASTADPRTSPASTPLKEGHR